jgi:hypothetical protein
MVSMLIAPTLIGLRVGAACVLAMLGQRYCVAASMAIVTVTSSPISGTYLTI